MRSMLAGFVTGMALALALILGTTPHCPAEDSCAVDYRHGRYVVTETTP